METHAVGKFLIALSIAGALLTAGYILLPVSSDDKALADAYPRSPLEILSPIHYLGATVNESDAAITTFVLNLTVASETMFSSPPKSDQEINITTLYIRYSDTHGLYTLEPGAYSVRGWENGDGDGALELGEVMELTLPLQQPVSANTNFYAEFWIPYHGTLTLLFCTPEVIELSGQVTEFTAAPFVPY